MRFILMFLIAVVAIVAAAIFLYYGPLAIGAADACEPADLSASAKWQTSDPLSGSIRFLNQSGEACSLRGKPELRLQDAATGSLNVSSPGDAAFGRTELAPGKTAAASVTWRNWCGAALNGPLYLMLRLPGSENEMLVPIVDAANRPVATFPACEDPNSASGLEAGGFKASGS